MFSPFLAATIKECHVLSIPLLIIYLIFYIFTLQGQPSVVSSENLSHQKANESSQTQSTVVESQSIDLTLGSANVVDLSDDTPLAKAKGKRRSAAASGGKKGTDSPNASTASNVGSHERLLKSIKQEKP